MSFPQSRFNSQLLRYDGDDATTKDPAPIPAQLSVIEPPESGPAPGYGEEPEIEHDPTAFEVEMDTLDMPVMGSNGDHQDQRDTGYGSPPGIHMKDDG